MSAQAIATGLLLPPLLLAVVGLVASLLAWRGHRAAALLSALAAAGLLVLATPFAAGSLRNALDDAILPSDPALAPGAIVILGAEMAFGRDGPDIGAMTLERLRAGVALHRRTGLPILVTGGPLSPGEPPIATLMARSLAADFAAPPRWIEPAARDTRDNAVLGAAMLRADGIDAVLIVTHGWHMVRAQEAFARTGLETVAAPVRIGLRPGGIAADFVPRADHLAESWLFLRELAGRVVYAWRDPAAS